MRSLYTAGLLFFLALQSGTSISVYAEQNGRLGPAETTKQLRTDLMGKTKIQVKAYFGREPDGKFPYEPNTSYVWRYNGEFYSPENQHTYDIAVIQFLDGGRGVVGGVNCLIDFNKRK